MGKGEFNAKGKKECEGHEGLQREKQEGRSHGKLTKEGERRNSKPNDSKRKRRKRTEDAKARRNAKRKAKERGEDNSHNLQRNDAMEVFLGHYFGVDIHIAFGSICVSVCVGSRITAVAVQLSAAKLARRALMRRGESRDGGPGRGHSGEAEGEQKRGAASTGSNCAGCSRSRPRVLHAKGRDGGSGRGRDEAENANNVAAGGSRHRPHKRHADGDGRGGRRSLFVLPGRLVGLCWLGGVRPSADLEDAAQTAQPEAPMYEGPYWTKGKFFASAHQFA
ncbi:hypothetical protein B0H16DRAFT_1481133 [Mycena metata]|uniref:Uncharacterized protein n=1 Tax=Mycena metata TaxID=1033252 RepID=A0AAD7H0A2_9AGAR|nr:hypothetical protein B0H16DRAFT_1481133 [Mycena metata]